MTTQNISSQPSGGLYIHIPFCRKKCLYCDFFSGGASLLTPQFIEKFTTNLLKEIEFRNTELPGILRTVYIGGGTPTVLPSAEFERIANCIKRCFEGRMQIEEFTVEANPEDVTEELLQTLRDIGVTRLSLGIQSLSDERLKSVGRIHTGETALNALRLAHKYFDNVSVDVMFGFPALSEHGEEQEKQALRSTLSQLIAERPEHISAYSLMYESSTPLTVLRDNGKIRELPEGTSLDMFAIVSDMLAKAGYERYEISNYALPGYRSIHNSAYWDAKPYLGIGPSAHSYDGMYTRRANPADIRGYMQYVFSNDHKTSFYTEEVLGDDECREECIMLSLRKREGVDLSYFSQRFGATALQTMLKKATPFIEHGQLILSDTHLHLAESAIMQSDSIIVEII